MSRLPLCLPPLADETFTSWLVRLAAAHGLGSITFCNLVAGGSVQFNRDMDGLASERLLVALAEQTGHSPESLREQHTFSGFEGKLFRRLSASTKNPWVLPMGSVTNRLPSLQFCPLCLASDKIPYFRRAWRLSLFAACPVHAVRLRHVCPKCGKVVSPVRGHLHHAAGTTPLCWGCGLDLREVPSDQVEDSDAKFAHDLQSALDGDVSPVCAPLGVGPQDYFAALSVVCTRLTTDRPRLRRWRKEAAAGAHTELPAPIRNSGVRAFDTLSDPVARLAVLRTAEWLLEAWPDRFLKLAKDTGTRPSDLVMFFSRNPSWFIKPLQTLPLSIHRASSPSTAAVRAKQRREFILTHRKLWSVNRQHRLVAALCKAGFYPRDTDFRGITSSVRRTIATLRAEGSNYRKRATRQVGRDTPEWQELLRLAVPFRKENCRSAEQLQRGIRRLCEGIYLSTFDLSELLERCQDVLKAKHLTMMVREGWLETRHGPCANGFRSNPQQAYRSVLTPSS